MEYLASSISRAGTDPGQGGAWPGPARQGRARRGSAGQGRARSGEARQGPARQGKEFLEDGSCERLKSETFAK